MRYYKVINDGYLDLVGTGFGGTEISEDEYNAIIEIVKTCPTAPDGYAYRLKTDITWELYELPIVEEELTAEEALAIILGGEV